MSLAAALAGPTLPDLDDWPLFGWSDEARPALGRALERGPAVLATIIALEGGGPRPIGTQMVFGDGVLDGYLSGGCIEADVAAHAQSCLIDGAPRTLIYGEGSPWGDIRLLCGARLEVFVEAIPPGDPAALALAASAEIRTPVWWASDGGRRACLTAQPAARREATVLRPYVPIPRLVIFGADPIALAIAQTGVLAGFETHLVRDKGPSTAPPILGVRYHRAEPAAVLSALGGGDPWTYVAVCGHEPERDHAALVSALSGQAAYVGLLGARRRLEPRLTALREAGVADDALDRLRAPIGLDLGGKAPFEVAIAVLAEMILVRRGGQAARPAPKADSTLVEWPRAAQAHTGG
jgi:xanthine dehydrogenase accessory factor